MQASISRRMVFGLAIALTLTATAVSEWIYYEGAVQPQAAEILSTHMRSLKDDAERALPAKLPYYDVGWSLLPNCELLLEGCLKEDVLLRSTLLTGYYPDTKNAVLVSSSCQSPSCLQVRPGVFVTPIGSEERRALLKRRTQNTEIKMGRIGAYEYRIKEDIVRFDG